MKARQKRQPVDDLEVNAKPFPDLERIPHLQIDGHAFADSLMVLEFVQNFAHVLKIGNFWLDFPTFYSLLFIICRFNIRLNVYNSSFLQIFIWFDLNENEVIE